MTENLKEILLIEDNPGDVILIKKALSNGMNISNLNVVTDGEMALEYLRQLNDYKSATQPDLIILDLNIPKKDGREVLNEIKKDEKLKCIPVVVFTSSTFEKDIIETYNSYVNCYITKPENLDQFFHVIKLIEEFWFTVVKLPPHR